MRVPVIPWSPGITPAWDIAEIKAALNQHEAGEFQASSTMATAMGRDDRITAVIETRVKGLLSLPFQMVPADVDDSKEKARDIADTVAAHWPVIAPPAQLTNALWWFILLGLVPIKVEWRTIEDLWVPTMQVFDPQFLRWDDSDRVYKINTEQGELDVTPENGWLMMVQGERGWMRGSVRAIADHWISRQWVIRDWNRFNERHGLPILKAMVPAGARGSEKRDFGNSMSTIGSNNTVVLPQGVDGETGSYDLQLLEAKDRSWDSFKGLADQANKDIAVHILGQNLTTEVSSGSFAAAAIHDRVRLDRLEGDAELLSSAIREGMLVPMIQFNFGEPETFAPHPTWDTAPPTDLVANGQALKALGEGITAIKAAGFDLAPDSIEELGQEYNIKLVPAEVEEPEPAPAPGAGPGEPTEEEEEESA